MSVSVKIILKSCFTVSKFPLWGPKSYGITIEIWEKVLLYIILSSTQSYDLYFLVIELYGADREVK